MKLITVKLPEPYIKALDASVEAKLYPSRSEAIRCAIRDLLQSEGSLKVRVPSAKTWVAKEPRVVDLGFCPRCNDALLPAAGGLPFKVVDGLKFCVFCAGRVEMNLAEREKCFSLPLVKKALGVHS